MMEKKCNACGAPTSGSKCEYCGAKIKKAISGQDTSLSSLNETPTMTNKQEGMWTPDKRNKSILIGTIAVIFLVVIGAFLIFRSVNSEAEEHELVGEWRWDSTGTPWFRFYADGSAVNLQDGEDFTWNEDGSLNAIIYESWHVNGDNLTITWTTGASFEYTRIDEE